MGEFQCNQRGIGHGEAIVQELGPEVRVKALDGTGAGQIILEGAISQ